MAQSVHLVMVGLGVEADTPPVDIQPPLSDGVHLRWAFRREAGFPRQTVVAAWRWMT
jgi:hypothetical protein